MSKIKKLIKRMPPIGSMIRLYGQEMEVVEYRIRADAAYIICRDGLRLEQTVHIDNLEKLVENNEI